MVDSIARNWKERRDKTKTGKFMNHFTGFCSTLDAHSNMLEVLPNGNQYVSLFTGSLKSIIKVTFSPTDRNKKTIEFFLY